MNFKARTRLKFEELLNESTSKESFLSSDSPRSDFGKDNYRAEKIHKITLQRPTEDDTRDELQTNGYSVNISDILDETIHDSIRKNILSNSIYSDESNHPEKPYEEVDKEKGEILSLYNSEGLLNHAPVRKNIRKTHNLSTEEIMNNKNDSYRSSFESQDALLSVWWQPEKEELARLPPFHDNSQKMPISLKSAAKPYRSKTTKSKLSNTSSSIRSKETVTSQSEPSLESKLSSVNDSDEHGLISNVKSDVYSSTAIDSLQTDLDESTDVNSKTITNYRKRNKKVNKNIEESDSIQTSNFETSSNENYIGKSLNDSSSLNQLSSENDTDSSSLLALPTKSRGPIRMPAKIKEISKSKQKKVKTRKKLLPPPQLPHLNRSDSTLTSDKTLITEDGSHETSEEQISRESAEIGAIVDENELQETPDEEKKEICEKIPPEFPKKKQRKKDKQEADVQPDVSEESNTLSGADLPTEELELHSILGIVIHQVDGIKMNVLISHPVVQVHLFDLETGEYIFKKNSAKSVTSYYESQTNVHHIMPIMTQPFNMKQQQKFVPEWQEMLVFNEDFDYFIQEKPDVLIVFEILDFVSMSLAKKKYQRLGKEGGWHRIAWAFLKLRGANCKLNIEKKLQLQLYYPFKRKSLLSSCAKESELYRWWNLKEKKKYPHTLFVTVKRISVPKVQPRMRSMLPTQEEKGETTLHDLFEGSSTNYEIQSSSSTDVIGKKVAQPEWSRKPGEPLKIPNQFARSLPAGKNGCFAIQFSHSGLYLACGCVENSSHYIVMYEIPSWRRLKTMREHLGLIYDLRWSIHDELLYSVSADCSLRVWNWNSGSDETSLLLPHPSFVYCIDIHPVENSVLASGCYDHNVRIWETKNTNHILKELTQHKSFVNAICFDAKGEKLFSGDGIGVICIWKAQVYSSVNSQEWLLLHELKLEYCMGSVINDIICHPVSPRIAISCRNNSIVICDKREFVCVQQLKDVKNTTHFIHCDISPCGNYVLSGSENGLVHMWNVYSGEKVHTYSNLPYGEHTVSSVKFHPHEHMFACSAYGENFPIILFKFDSNAPEIPQKQTEIRSFKMDDENVHNNDEASLNTFPLPKRPSNSILKKSKGRKRLPPLSNFTPSKNEKNSSDKKTIESFPSSLEIPKSSSSSVLERSDSSSSHESVKTILPEKQRSIIFEDEVSVTHKWKKVFDKLDHLIHFSGVKWKSVTLNGQSDENLHFDDVKSSSDVTDSEKTSSETSKCSSSEIVPFKAVALYSYTARNSKELNLKPGDIIFVSRKINDFWWEGKSALGITGIFPSQYVYMSNDSSSPTTS